MYSQDNSSYPKIGEVYFMRFDGRGSEQNGWRPGLVFQNNIGNKHSPNIIALPLTSSSKKNTQPTHVRVSAEKSGLRCDSVILCENPERMSKEKIGQYITTLSDSDMKRVAEASLLATSVISFLDFSLLISVWEKANKLNFQEVR